MTGSTILQTVQRLSLSFERPRFARRQLQASKRRDNWVGQVFSVGLVCPLLVLSTSSFATTQCPAEFGPKSPIVDASGWLVVALGIVLGGLLLGYVIKRSRGARLIRRIAVIGLGLVGMIVVSVCGLVLAIAFFFLQC